MKIITGLVPIVRAQHNGGFLTDFATAEDSHKGPRGTIVSTLYTDKEPTVEKKGHTFTYMLGALLAGGRERHLTHEGVPEDAQRSVTEGLHEGPYEDRYEWYEVTL